MVPRYRNREWRRLPSETGVVTRSIRPAPGQFEAFAALRIRVSEVTADEAIGMTVSDLENRFDVKVEQVIIFLLPPMLHKQPGKE